MDVVAYGVFFALGMERFLMMGLGAILKRFIRQVQLDVEGLQLQNAK